MKGKECKQGMKTSIWKLKLDIDRQSEKNIYASWPNQWPQSWGGYSDPLDLVNFSVMHNEMIEANGLCYFKTTDNTFCLIKADELKQ